ncbi:MAG TPA: acetyl-CoA C-acetyltransferase [Acidimicrobiales bacterium]|jgi:acetyl-CoA C-acetyltransferase
MIDDRDALIIDGVRTPRGKGRATGALHHLHPQDLLGQCLNALVERNGIDPSDVDDVIMGNGNSVGDHNADIARLAVLDCGWPVAAPGLTINRFCGSGQQAVSLGAMGIRAGFQELVVAGGVESMSRWPVDQTPLLIDGDNPHLRELYPMVPQGISADAIAALEGFTRSACDELAVTSQERAAKAIAEGRFDRSLIAVHNPDGSVALDHEEHPRSGTTLDTLAGLSPSFETLGTQLLPGMNRSFDTMIAEVYPAIGTLEHVHHPGNSSGVVDGASSILLASPGYARAHGLVPRARIVMGATAGAEPVIMLTAPAPAARRCLELAGMTADDIDLWEINEAFASVVLKAIRDLDLNPEKVNVNGGAMALGHPIGATGAMLIETALDELERTDSSTALVAMCTGGGMGTATIIERV